MTSIASGNRWRALAPSVRAGLIIVALVACTPAPLPSTSGQTTTTYGSNGTMNTDDGDTIDVTDDGAPDETTGTDPDPSDTDPDTDDGSFPCDFGCPADVGGTGGAPNGSSCTGDPECNSGNCYVLPFLGGFCGECNEDADCVDGGCSPPNPFDGSAPVCNMGELGGGCESDDVCAGDLSCSTALDLFGLVQINSCSSCQDDDECGDQICAPLLDLSQFAGHRECIDAQSLPQNAYCELEFNGNEACASGVCSIVDVMGLAQLGACGECNVDANCNGGVCAAGEFILDSAMLLGTTCP
jgi:hypothetical protein